MMIRLIIFLSKRIIAGGYKNCRGYSMVELLLATVVGSITLGAAYASYDVIGKQYKRILAYSEVQEFGMPVLGIISRDIRLAGYKAIDASLASTYGAVTDAITITDSGNACCDSIVLTYDKSTTQRYRITYFTQTRTTPTTRQAIYMDKEQWNGVNWTTIVDDSLVTDYVEDLQFSGSDLDSNGDPMIVDIFLVTRSRTAIPRSKTYANPGETISNYTYSFTDKYHRDEFAATVNVRNLR